MVEDHGERRALARAAVAGQWSVRELEARARDLAAASGKPKARSRRSASVLHPDQEDALVRIADTLGSVLGRELEVRPAAGGHGYRVQLSFDSVEDALDLARRLTVRSVA
jgi:ParB family chromosome partitioning protein